MKTYFLAATAAFALTACGGGATDADADGDGTITQDEAAAAVAEAQINPGQWENTVEFVDVELDASALREEARGFLGPVLESMKGQISTTQKCVTPEEASRPAASMFSGDENANCEYDKFEFSGGSIDLEMTCTDPSGVTSNITSAGTYSPDEFDMDMTIAIEGSEMGNMKIIASGNGRRTGDCEG